MTPLERAAVRYAKLVKDDPGKHGWRLSSAELYCLAIEAVLFSRGLRADSESLPGKDVTLIAPPGTAL